jgi:outer membrane protein OmpA-like peptidoglycan-associated protein
MKNLILIILIHFSVNLNSQVNLKGNWQGILLKDGKKSAESEIFYLSIEMNGTSINGKSREEYYRSTNYIIQKTKGSVEKNEIKITQFIVEKKKISSKISVCSIDLNLHYVDSTGYLEGTFISNSCRGNTGKIILYRSTVTFSDADPVLIDHSWRDRFLLDLSKGRKAPEIQELERKNFQFQPIYFDHDKAEIKPEFYNYLAKMARVVNGHSDLRIKIIGHTDADGSDIYNVDLSARRAKAIHEYFLKCGLESFKLVIDFKGEKMPIDNNQTNEGKQHNRRVDFQFI